MLGYIIRIIPLVQFIGAFLTGMSWYLLGKKWGKNKAYIVAAVGSFIVFAGFILSIVQGLISPKIVAPWQELLANTTSPSMNATLSGSALASYLEKIAEQDGSPLNYLSPLLIAVGLFIESIGFKRLSIDTDQAMPRYLYMLFIVLGIFSILQLPAIWFTVASLKHYAAIFSTKTSITLKEIFTTLITISAPLTIVGLLVFVMGLIIYIIAVYKFYKLGKIIEEEIILEEAQEVKGTGTEGEEKELDIEFEEENGEEEI